MQIENENQKSLSSSWNKNGNITPSSNIFNEELIKQVSDMNITQINLEKYLKQSVDILDGVEIGLETELEKKNYYLSLYESAAKYYNDYEINYKLIIFLYEERVQRLINTKINQQQLIESDTENVRK